MNLDKQKVAELKEKAEGYFSKGKYAKALDAYEKIRPFGKTDPRVFIRIGDISRKLDDKPGAVDAYKDAVKAFTKQGFLIKAIGVCKIITSLDPMEVGIQENLAKLCEEAGISAPSSGPTSRPAPTKPHGGAASPSTSLEPPAPAPSEAGDEEVLDDIEEVTPSGDIAPEETGKKRTFPRTPLFSDFTKDELFEVVKLVNFLSIEPGNTVFTEGDDGDSIYILVNGAIEVVGHATDGTEVVISHLREGDFFGEFGFFSNSKRKTSVKTLAPTEVLELRKSDMDELIQKHPRISDVLFEFYKERVVDRLLALSETFRPINEADRKEILKRLVLEHYRPTTDIMQEGDTGDTMYLIKSGTVEVWVGSVGTRKVIKELKEGDFFGEIALATNKPRQATVTAKTDVETVAFSRPMIKDILSKYPIIKDILLGVIKERMDGTEKIKQDSSGSLL